MLKVWMFAEAFPKMILRFYIFVCLLGKWVSGLFGYAAGIFFRLVWQNIW